MAISTCKAYATAIDPAPFPSLDDVTAPISRNTNLTGSGPLVLRNDTALQDTGYRRVLDYHAPMCAPATYINAIDLLAYLALRPASGLQDPISHQSSGAVYDRVTINIYGTTETARLKRDLALTGLYMALDFISDTDSFYAYTQESVGLRGRAVAFIKIYPSDSTTPTIQEHALTITKRSNFTQPDDSLCQSFPTTGELKGSSNKNKTDVWQPATNDSDIDTLLESPTSAALPPDDTDSATSDDWFIWQDPNSRSLQFRCRFFPGPTLDLNAVYMPFARYIWHGGFNYEEGINKPAIPINVKNAQTHLNFLVGGAPTGKAINLGFTNKLALISLGRIPRIMFEKRTWKGIQVQVIYRGYRVGVIALISDRASVTPITLPNSGNSSVDVA